MTYVDTLRSARLVLQVSQELKKPKINRKILQMKSWSLATITKVMGQFNESRILYQGGARDSL